MSAPSTPRLTDLDRARATEQLHVAALLFGERSSTISKVFKERKNQLNAISLVFVLDSYIVCLQYITILTTVDVLLVIRCSRSINSPV